MSPQRFQFLTTGPTLRTLRGCKERIHHLSLAETWALSYALNLTDAADLPRALWALNSKQNHTQTHIQRRQHIRAWMEQPKLERSANGDIPDGMSISHCVASLAVGVPG